MRPKMIVKDDDDDFELSDELIQRLERQMEEIENGTAKLYTMEEMKARWSEERKKLVEEARKRLNGHG